MKVKAIGKQSIKSKKGTLYTVVHYEEQLRGEKAEGVRTTSVWLEANLHPYSTIKVGNMYNAEYNSSGYCVDFQLA